ncbi:MAG: metallophosphoesterase [Bacteroidota bacterium]|nr:metallophosphoesterase [Bacteroidota bacterium]
MAYRIVFTMLMFIVLFNGITDWYFYKRVLKRFNAPQWLKKTHIGISLFFVGYIIFLIYKFINPYTDPTSTVYVWGTYTFLLFYLPKLAFLLLSWPELIWKKTKGFSIAGGVLGLTIAGCMLWGSLVGRFQFQENKVNIPSDRLPKAFDGYTVVQFSDTHLGNFGHDNSIIQEMVDRINATHPDLIVFTGDLVNTKSGEIDRFYPILTKLKARDGVYSIMGNHDYGDYVYWRKPYEHQENLDNLHKKQASLGWKMLNNQSVYLHRGNDSIALIGVENWGEPPFHQYGNLTMAMKNVNSTCYKLLLSHNPEHWRRIILPNIKYDIDLTLAGHTHAWQMAIKIGHKRYSPAAFKYPNWGGLSEEKGKYLYVNEGIGYVMWPMRFGTGPEITVLRLCKN